MLRRIPKTAVLIEASEGTSATEFALILPALLLMLLAGVQVVQFVDASRKVERVANSISQMISQATPPNQSSTSAAVTAQDIHFSYDAAMVIFPYLLRDAASKGISWWQDININYASVQFTQISTSCGTNTDQSSCYIAKVLWTSTGTSGGQYRPCLIPQLPGPDNATTGRTMLPKSLYGPGSIIAIDVTFVFVPSFASKYLPNITISRSVFVQPRYADVINLDTTNNDGIVTRCL